MAGRENDNGRALIPARPFEMIFKIRRSAVAFKLFDADAQIVDHIFLL